MSYSRLYESSNEFVKERLELVMERIGQIADEKAASVGEAYREYFTGASAYLLVLDSLAKKALSGELAAFSSAIWPIRSITSSKRSLTNSLDDSYNLL